MKIAAENPLAVALIDAIHKGDVPSLQRLLEDNPDLATARIVTTKRRQESHALLHVATDWPGHFPNGSEIVALLTNAGSEANARFVGPHAETPLHWAASSNDVEVLDALLDAGADIEAPGAVIAGGTALDDAVAFGQWDAAHRLVDRGARAALWHAAALGLTDRVQRHFAGDPLPARHPWGAKSAKPPDGLTVAFWCACHGGQLQAAKYLLERGAELNWISVWDGLTPLDAANREAHAELSRTAPSNRRPAEQLVSWLRDRGAKPAREITGAT